MNNNIFFSFGATHDPFPFVLARELVSNASDAIEKLRYLQMTGECLSAGDRALEIDLRTDKVARTLTIADSGVGMTREEMVDNLGTIARSGSKAFMQEVESKAKVRQGKRVEKNRK